MTSKEKITSKPQKSCKSPTQNNVPSSLRPYFPMLRTRETILSEIHDNWKLSQTFHSWTEKQQAYFLDMCTGVRGVKTTYDPFFKEYMNPESSPERLSDFLSLILQQKVKVLKVLPNDTTRITAESTLLITDVVVELEDGSIVNVEMQKIGYAFPGERAACYSADLLLRQYKRIKSLSPDSDTFDYRLIKPVYTIIIFEKSPAEFKQFQDTYIHKISPKSDTGISLQLLQNFIFISLDIFMENRHNQAITGKLDTWLLFFASDRPEDVISIIEAYPEFKAMFEDVYELCRNTEDVMGLFSKELFELDKGTTKFMLDEMQEEIDELTEENDDLKEENDGLKEEIDDLLISVTEKDNALAEKDTLIAKLQAELEQLKK